MQLQVEHLSGAGGGALDVLTGALSGAASSLSLPRVSLDVRCLPEQRASGRRP